MSQQRAKRINGIRLISAVGITFWIMIVLLPIYWMIITSIKSPAEIMSFENPLIVKKVVWTHYQNLFQFTKFKYWFLNSILITGGVTAIAIPVSALGAYAIVRLRFAGKKIFSRAILFSYLIPQILLGLSLYTVFAQIGLMDTYGGLLLAYLTVVLPFCTWILTGYFRTLPPELEECARVDGCSRIGAMVRITIPLAAPGIITAIIFTFTLSWTQFVYPLILLSDSYKRPVPVGIAGLMYGDMIMWGQIMAGGLLYTIPVILVYIFLQKYMVGGLTAGSVKG